MSFPLAGRTPLFRAALTFASFCRVYLISALTSLEGNTTPTIEPYFLSLLGSHSMLSSVVIITSVSRSFAPLPLSRLADLSPSQ